MRTIITHFFNESFMLPFWLRHHLPLFDYGILIDHGSTDNSAAICRQLAPHWRYVRSRLDCFDAALTDAEVMRWEWDLAGFKLVLNVSEFLAATPESLDWMDTQLGVRNGAWLQAKIMIDSSPDVMPDPSRSLLESKSSGLFQSELLARLPRGEQDSLHRLLQINRARLYHQAHCGCYWEGRHNTNLSIPGACDPSCAHICWYMFSPWCEPFRERKLAFRSRLPENDLRNGRGFQHAWGRPELDTNFRRLSALLSPSIEAAQR